MTGGERRQEFAIGIDKHEIEFLTCAVFDRDGCLVESKHHIGGF